MRCRCLIVNQRPTCNFTFDSHSRASGTTQMTRVPQGGSVAFQSCGVWMDNNNVTSTTCFRVSPTAHFGGRMHSCAPDHREFTSLS